MMDLREEVVEIQEKLAQERDHLRVKAHLLKAELRDEWEEAEKNWQSFESKATRLAKTGRDSADDVAESVKHLGLELKQAFKKFKDSL